MSLSFLRLRGTRLLRGCGGALMCGTLLSSTGCGLLPSREDIGNATSYVKDQVTGKARLDRLTKNYSEARILERRKDYVGAARLYQEVLAEEPKSRDCYHRLGVMAAVQGKYDEAHAHYQTALSCDTPTADLLGDIGYCFYMQQNLEQAEQSLRQAIALQPQHRQSLNNLAMVLGEQGKLEESYQLFRQANSEAEAESNFAYLCAHCGDLAAAQQHFSRALSIDPTMKPAAEALLQVSSRMQAMQAAHDRQAAEQSGVREVQQAGGWDSAAGADGRVDPASHTIPVGMNRSRPMIEVYTGGPRSPATSAAIAQASQAESSKPAATPGSAASNQPGAPVAPGPTQPTLLHPPVGAGQPIGGGSSAAPAGNQGPINTPPINTAPINTVQPGAVNPSAVNPQTVAPSAGLSPFAVPSMPQPQYLQPSNTPPTQRAGNAEPGDPTAGAFPSLVR